MTTTAQTHTRGTQQFPATVACPPDTTFVSAHTALLVLGQLTRSWPSDHATDGKAHGTCADLSGNQPKAMPTVIELNTYEPRPPAYPVTT